MEIPLIVTASVLFVMLVVSELLGMTSNPKVNSILQLVFSIFFKQIESRDPVVVKIESDKQ
jgi:hypothetical protein